MPSSLPPVVLSAVLALALPAGADEGRVAIAGVTTITQPGHYVLTRDIPSGTGAAITVSASNVTLDLGGRAITRANQPGIIISAGYRDVTIRNGRIRGASYGVYDVSGAPHPGSAWTSREVPTRSSSQGSRSCTSPDAVSRAPWTTGSTQMGTRRRSPER